VKSPLGITTWLVECKGFGRGGGERNSRDVFVKIPPVLNHVWGSSAGCRVKIINLREFCNRNGYYLLTKRWGGVLVGLKVNEEKKKYIPHNIVLGEFPYI